MEDFCSLCSSQDSDWSLFSSGTDDEISLDDIAEITNIASIAPIAPKNPDQDLFNSDDFPETEISFGEDDLIKLADSSDNDDPRSIDSFCISIEELQESQSDLSSLSTTPAIPDFDQLENLPYEIVERSRYFSSRQE
jgi:hypothetical protein